MKKHLVLTAWGISRRSSRTSSRNRHRRKLKYLVRDRTTCTCVVMTTRTRCSLVQYLRVACNQHGSTEQRLMFRLMSADARLFSFPTALTGLQLAEPALQHMKPASVSRGRLHDHAGEPSLASCFVVCFACIASCFV